MKAGWQTSCLGDCAAVSTGPFGSILHKSDYVDDGVPLVNPINIVGDSIVPDTSKLISGETIKRLSNYVLDEGDVVVGRRGEIGRCAVVGPNEKGWVCGTGSFFVRPSPSLDSQFLAHLIRSPEYREQLENLSTGTTMKNLSNTALGSLVISAPLSPNSTASLPSSTKPSTASLPPKPTPKRTSRTPAPCLKATCNPFLRSGETDGWKRLSVRKLTCLSGLHSRAPNTPTVTKTFVYFEETT